ncbi:MAG: endonuclease III [Candidatus Woesearchaeota archaeon]
MEKDKKTIVKIIKILENYEEIRKAPVFEFKKMNQTPFQILISTLLSTRTRDEITIKVVKNLFSKYSTPEEISKLNLKELEGLLKPIGFYRSKAKYVHEISKIIVEKGYPKRYEEFIELPGVGRKIANIVYSEVYDEDLIGVDVHVHRISNRLGLVNTKNPHETEKVLENITPKKYKKVLNLYFVALGQTICKAKPQCEICRLSSLCEYSKIHRNK